MWDNLSLKNMNAERRRHNPRLSVVFQSGLCRSAHHRRNPGMFKGIGALPQRAKSGWVYTQTLLAQFDKRQYDQQTNKDLLPLTQFSLGIFN